MSIRVEVSASYYYIWPDEQRGIVEAHHTDLPGRFSVYINADSDAEFTEYVARFPKYVGIRNHRGSKNSGYMIASIGNVNDTTGAVNETAWKRVRKFIEVARDDIVMLTGFRNSYRTLAAFEAIVPKL